jgi:tyrosinase
MGVRRNIALNTPASRAARDAYVQGVLALKAEDTGLTTDGLGLPRRAGVPDQMISTYELFVVWHVWAMNLLTPPTQGSRNAAHSGPAFLPWHRWFMILLEWQFQRVLGNSDFGLPYWDWATDGERPISDQPDQPVWAANSMGGNGRLSDGVVTAGPFRASGPFGIRIEVGPDGVLRAADRPLRRTFGHRGAPPFGLPIKADVADAMDETSYDRPDWDSNMNLGGHRNRLEGWARVNGSFPPNLHNLVHVWVGGDMSPASSPNDPVFFLNHCNVDRIWEAWRTATTGRRYVPAQSASSDLFRHRRNDPLYSLLTSQQPTPGQVWNVTNLYTYDSLNVG